MKPTANEAVIDPVKVSVWDEDGFLVVEVENATSLADRVSKPDANGKVHAGVPAQIFIDLDNNPATGARNNDADEAKRPLEGYDAKVSLHLGLASLQDGGVSAASGTVLHDTAKGPVLGAYATPAVWAAGLEKAGREASRALDAAGRDSTDLGTIDGKTVRVRIPHGMLALKPGDTIRLCWHDYHQGNYDTPTYSDDKTLKISSGPTDYTKVTRRARPWEDFAKAADAGNTEELDRLIKQGVPTSLYDDALRRAASSGHVDAMNRLIAAGTNVNTADSYGQTALFLAASSGKKNAVLALLAKGAKPTTTTQSGETPLLRSIQWRDIEIVKALLEAGADPSVRPAQGMSPLELAERMEATDIADLLKSHKPATPPPAEVSPAAPPAPSPATPTTPEVPTGN